MILLGISPFIWAVSLWEAFFLVVSQKWIPFPTARCKSSALLSVAEFASWATGTLGASPSKVLSLQHGFAPSVRSAKRIPEKHEENCPVFGDDSWVSFGGCRSHGLAKSKRGLVGPQSKAFPSAGDTPDQNQQYHSLCTFPSPSGLGDPKNHLRSRRIKMGRKPRQFPVAKLRRVFSFSDVSGRGLLKIPHADDPHFDDRALKTDIMRLGAAVLSQSKSQQRDTREQAHTHREAHKDAGASTNTPHKHTPHRCTCEHTCKWNHTRRHKPTQSTHTRATPIRTYTDTPIRTYTDTPIRTCTDTQIHRYTDTQIHRYTDTRYTDTQIHAHTSLPEFLDFILF